MYQLAILVIESSIVQHPPLFALHKIFYAKSGKLEDLRRAGAEIEINTVCKGISYNITPPCAP